VFEDFSMVVDERRVVCILGPSGAGKSTLLNIISGLITQDEGEIRGFAGRSVSYLFQEPRLLPWKNARDNIEFVLKDKMSKSQRERVTAEYLELVGLGDFKYYYPAKLSGGMKQRVSIARAFAYPADILLMDEPFKGLDPQLKMQLMEAFLNLWQMDRRSVFFVTHDISEAVMLGEDILILSERPARIKKRIIHPLPHAARDANSAEMLALEKEIYDCLESRQGE